MLPHNKNAMTATGILVFALILALVVNLFRISAKQKKDMDDYLNGMFTVTLLVLPLFAAAQGSEIKLSTLYDESLERYDRSDTFPYRSDQIQWPVGANGTVRWSRPGEPPYQYTGLPENYSIISVPAKGSNETMFSAVVGGMIMQQDSSITTGSLASIEAMKVLALGDKNDQFGIHFGVDAFRIAYWDRSIQAKSETFGFSILAGVNNTNIMWEADLFGSAKISYGFNGKLFYGLNFRLTPFDHQRVQFMLGGDVGIFDHNPVVVPQMYFSYRMF